MQKIILTSSPSGGVKIEANGIAGPACVSTLDKILKNDPVKRRVNNADFSRRASTNARTRQKS